MVFAGGWCWRPGSLRCLDGVDDFQFSQANFRLVYCKQCGFLYHIVVVFIFVFIGIDEMLYFVCTFYFHN